MKFWNFALKNSLRTLVYNRLKSAYRPASRHAIHAYGPTIHSVTSNCSIEQILIRWAAMVLCIGPEGSGKSLLLKKIQNPDYVDNTTTSVPTVGTNILSLKVADKLYTIREVGGALAPIWPKYFGNVGKVMYVVDVSNLCQISAAGVLLYTVLVNPLLRKAKFLLVLTKMDVSYRQMRNEALLILQMERLRREVTQLITIVEASAISGEGRDDILKWITDA